MAPNTIILVKNDKILQYVKAITNALINCFTDITHSLGLKKKNIGLEKLLSEIVESFINSESIKKIKGTLI